VEAQQAQAYRKLAGRQRIFAALIGRYGRPEPFVWHDGGRTGSSLFPALCLHIVGQKISAVVTFRCSIG
jgi:DNA-3-methyladenine glycosylase II